MENNTNVELSREASGILKIFGYEELLDFWRITHSLLELWNWKDVDEEEVRKQIESDPQDLILIQTARILSQMERRFYKPFKKIHVKFGSFDAKCHRIQQQLDKEMKKNKESRERLYHELIQHTILAEEAQNQL